MNFSYFVCLCFTISKINICTQLAFYDKKCNKVEYFQKSKAGFFSPIVNSGPDPSQGCTAYLVCLVQESGPGHTGKVQLSQSGDSPV